jgi:hypothetical protein
MRGCEGRLRGREREWRGCGGGGRKTLGPYGFSPASPALHLHFTARRTVLDRKKCPAVSQILSPSALRLRLQERKVGEDASRIFKSQANRTIASVRIPSPLIKHSHARFLPILFSILLASSAHLSLAQSAPWLAPYTGPSRNDIDPATLDGKVLCGYQGWFNTPNDGTPFGFSHWGSDLNKPGGHFTVDMWPDTSEYAPQDLASVPGFHMPDGSPALLYSAFRQGSVLLHLKWMRQYGIDGLFLSRFEGETADPTRLRHINTVLANVRMGCHLQGRVWAMMLDLSVAPGTPTSLVMNDWKFLCDSVRIREDSRYLHQHGKPVLLLWGLGFKDRPWTAQQAAELIDFFKNDPHYGNVYLIGGVDPYWRTLAGGSRQDPAWSKIYRSFDALSPWDAGRYHDAPTTDRVRNQVWQPDQDELNSLGKAYIPTAFPGFSWDNLKRTPPGQTKIPRQKGEFYWRQFATFKSLGIRTVFVGMFDEVNEGTAIFKVSNTVPAGQYFVTYEGLPSDWYLRLTGAATSMIRGDVPISWTIPANLPAPKR